MENETALPETPRRRAAALQPIALPPRRQRGGRWLRWLLLVVLLALAFWGGVVGKRRWDVYYTTAQAPLAPTGGCYFWRRMELPVPLFTQGDPRWSEDFLGPSNDTLGSAGCAVSSMAMVLKFYGIDTDPGRLNAFLDEHGGFTEQGWLIWEGAETLAPGRVKKIYEDLPSYALLDDNLRRGNPVIVRIRLPSGITHFVVVVGKDGFDYLIRDPASAGLRRGVYPLKDYGRPIEALRFYEKTTATVAGS